MTDGVEDFDAVAAALRADSSDVTTLARVLTATLGDAFPDGMVETERHRSLADRLAGRDGRAVALVVRAGDRVLSLREQPGGRVRAEVATVVRGVVISRRPVAVDAWCAALAEELTAAARQSAAARAALGRLLGT